MYWTFFTLLTVGYGDIHPTNTGERFYALMTMIMGSLMFGAIIAKVRPNIERLARRDRFFFFLNVTAPPLRRHCIRSAR